MRMTLNVKGKNKPCGIYNWPSYMEVIWQRNAVTVFTHVGSPVDCTAIPLVKGIDVCTSWEQEPHHLTVKEKNNSIQEICRISYFSCLSDHSLWKITSPLYRNVFNTLILHERQCTVEDLSFLLTQLCPYLCICFVLLEYCCISKWPSVHLLCTWFAYLMTHFHIEWLICI